MKLSKNFELWELLVSQQAVRMGIKNDPTPEHIENLKSLVTDLLQPLRDLTGRVMVISSGYRSPELNRIVGGSLTSQHSKGQAVDFMFSGLSAYNGCQAVIDSGLAFDQLIYEGTWIHVSYDKKVNRKQVLTAVFKPNQRTTYLPGLKRV